MNQPGRVAEIRWQWSTPDVGDWASDLQDNLPDEGRPVELYSGGMTGQSGDEDGNVGAILAPACP